MRRQNLKLGFAMARARRRTPNAKLFTGLLKTTDDLAAAVGHLPARWAAQRAQLEP